MDPMLLKLLPHRPPMLLIDEVIEVSAESAVVTKTFQEGDFGTHGGLVLDSILIECVAQAVAVLNGFSALESGAPAARGLLVGIGGFEFLAKARTGIPLRISCKGTDRFGPFRLADGQVEQQGQLLANGSLKFYIAEDEGAAQTM
jgi:3-hydroxyacyl-[acyl-carrier-protein] dehydratase